MNANRTPQTRNRSEISARNITSYTVHEKNVSREIEDLVETHLCKPRVILRVARTTGFVFLREGHIHVHRPCDRESYNMFEVMARCLGQSGCHADAVAASTRGTPSADLVRCRDAVTQRPPFRKKYYKYASYEFDRMSTYSILFFVRFFLPVCFLP